MTLNHARLWRTRLAGMVLAGLLACTPDKPSFHSIDLTGANYAQGFALNDHNGQARKLSDFQGRVTVVFFGYTQCPDVCPTTLAELVEVKRLLGVQGDKVQGIFVTVDPERDQAPMLKAYVEHFDPTFLAMVPTAEQLTVLAKDYKIYFKKVSGATSTSYTVDHSAGSYIYDPQGRLRLYVRYGMGAQAMAEDIQQLLR